MKRKLFSITLLTFITVQVFAVNASGRVLDLDGFTVEPLDVARNLTSADIDKAPMGHYAEAIGFYEEVTAQAKTDLSVLSPLQIDNDLAGLEAATSNWANVLSCLYDESEESGNFSLEIETAKAGRIKGKEEAKSLIAKLRESKDKSSAELEKASEDFRNAFDDQMSILVAVEVVAKYAPTLESAPAQMINSIQACIERNSSY